ncbi:hypothetical protein BV22DRAFT_262607 [Leucogyrophana mollusca]|uniref:Uncharacterized protein n=1 Tax=Leucogyrophana mollusca TaxID=85980 RepID=A0ACB8BPU7_9AGAM|nr:hypothetical protein BV22DRAFT_262607 [Leucogyrophana mollusca]
MSMDKHNWTGKGIFGTRISNVPFPSSLFQACAFEFVRVPEHPLAGVCYKLVHVGATLSILFRLARSITDAIENDRSAGRPNSPKPVNAAWSIEVSSSVSYIHLFVATRIIFFISRCTRPLRYIPQIPMRYCILFRGKLMEEQCIVPSSLEEWNLVGVTSPVGTNGSIEVGESELGLSAL